MHIVLGILGLLTAVYIFVMRARGAAEMTHELLDIADDVRAAARRLLRAVLRCNVTFSTRGYARYSVSTTTSLASIFGHGVVKADPVARVRPTRHLRALTAGPQETRSSATHHTKRQDGTRFSRTTSQRTTSSRTLVRPLRVCRRTDR